jgi:hypothetical protein
VGGAHSRSSAQGEEDQFAQTHALRLGAQPGIPGVGYQWFCALGMSPRVFSILICERKGLESLSDKTNCSLR